MTKKLTAKILCKEASNFSEKESKHEESSIYGVTDGKAIGTYLEHKFQNYLGRKYKYEKGSSARGIDFPGIKVDVKVTSIKQPQSSCPYKSARQKIYGLGYSLLVFVYKKTDNRKSRKGKLNILHGVFVEEKRTADYQLTTGIKRILDNNGNVDDLVAYMRDRFLPVDDIEANKIAKEILKKPPEVGYLTISNALQWRLQYSRIIEKAGEIEGIIRVR